MNKTNKYIISYIETEKSRFEYKPDFNYEYEYDEESENYNPEKDYEEEWEEDDWNEDDVEEDIYEEELSVYKHLAVIHTYPVSKYQIYRRSEISFLTVLAKIRALFSTFYSVFSFIFKFYSKNFENNFFIPMQRSCTFFDDFDFPSLSIVKIYSLLVSSP